MRANKTVSGVAERTVKLELIADSAIDELLLAALFSMLETNGDLVVSNSKSKFTWSNGKAD